jgi:hypothetical protein
LLIDGLYGDPEPAKRDLGIDPRTFTAEAVAELALRIPPLFGCSMRLVASDEERDDLRRHRTLARRTLLLVFLLLIIIPGEEIFWRGGVSLPLAGRLGPLAGSVAAAVLFALAHAALGIPFLVIAVFAAGLFWSFLAVKTRNLIGPLVSHLAWDLALLYRLPYG